MPDNATTISEKLSQVTLQTWVRYMTGIVVTVLLLVNIMPTSNISGFMWMVQPGEWYVVNMD